LIDLHVDTLLWTRMVGYDPNKRHASPKRRARPMGGHADMPRMIEGGMGAIGLGLVANPALKKDRAVALLHRYLDDLDRWIERAEGKLKKALTADDVLEAHAAGAVAAFTGLEGAHGLGGDLSHLAGLRDRGLRYVGMSHFTANEACHPCGGVGTNDEVGLHPWGRELVRECERLKIVVDLAHINQKGFLEVCEMAQRPVWVTHCGVRGVHDIWRNVDDDGLRAVADTGGCVGIIFVPYFLGGRLNCDLDLVCRHVEHVASVVGWDHVALGTDMDGFIPTLPRGFRDASDYPNVTAALLERGHDHADISKALGLNALRVFRDVCG
jgi:membrane dipeptidase